MTSKVILLFYQTAENQFLPFIRTEDSELRAIQRLEKKLKFNYVEGRFTHFLTFTFTDRPDFYAPLEKRDLAKRIRHWNRDPNLKWERFEGHKTLRAIHEFWGLTAYMRKFWNKVQSYCRYRNSPLFSYFWRLELGNQGQRPHFHALVSHSRIKNITKFVYDKFNQYWCAGFIDARPISNYLDAQHYISEYFTKKSLKNSKWKKHKERIWSSSRDVKVPPTNPNLHFIGSYTDLRKVKDYIEKHYEEKFGWGDHLTEQEKEMLHDIENVLSKNR
jgi:hypothetical protein